MLKTEFIKLYEELSTLNEAKADIDNFINKFGQETYDLFKKSTQRLKNNNVSTDIVWHTKYTEPKDLQNILYNLQNRIVTKDGNAASEIAGKYKFLGEKNGYKVYEILDHIAAMNLGTGTGWCIAGRYGHYDEPNYKPTEAEAEKHWNDYVKIGAQIFFFIGQESINDKFALVAYDKSKINYQASRDCNYEIYNAEDEVVPSIELKELPIDLIPNSLQHACKFCNKVVNISNLIPYKLAISYEDDDPIFCCNDCLPELNNKYIVCADCGRIDDKHFRFDDGQGTLYCLDCRSKHEKGLPKGVHFKIKEEDTVDEFWSSGFAYSKEYLLNTIKEYLDCMRDRDEIILIITSQVTGETLFNSQATPATLLTRLRKALKTTDFHWDD